MANRKRTGEHMNEPFRAPQKAAFGEQQVAELTPIVQLMANYGIRDELTETFTATGGSVSSTNSEFVCQTGTSSGGYGVIRSKRAVIYHPGQGIDMRFTARFTSPVALSLQAAGGFTSTDGLFFGYDGTTFGVMHRYGGRLEHRHLQITVAASGNETVTVTVNGTGYNVSVTSGTVNHNAYEIAVGLEADSAFDALYTVWQNGDTVEILAKADGDLNDTYSISSTGTCDGTWSRKQAGVTKTQDWYYQTDWNENTADWLDPTKGNVYRVQLQYLGYGSIKFYVEDPNDGEFILVHDIKWANENTGTSFTNPVMKLGWIAASLGSTTNLTVAGGSAAGFIEGKHRVSSLAHSAENTKTNVGTTLTNILSVRNNRAFKDTTNLSEASILLMSAASNGTKATYIEIFLNPTVAGETDWTLVEDGGSVVSYDTTGTTVTETTGHKFLTIVIPPGGGSETIGLNDMNFNLYPEDVVVACAKVSSGASAEVSISLTWQEDI